MFAQNLQTEIVNGSVHQAEITGYTHDGQGVARVDGRVVFIPGAIRGEMVEFTVLRRNKNVYAARLLRVLNRSSERQECLCPVYKTCGGCSLQHMSYAEELRFKQEKVAAALQRLGGLNGELPLQPIIAAAEPYHYRNKGIFHVAQTDGSTRLVFWNEASHQPAGARCNLLFPPDINRLAEWLEGMQLPANLTDIMLRYAHSSGELLLALILSDENIAATKSLLTQAADNFPMLKVYACQTPAGWQILSQEKQIADTLDKIEYLISPSAFFQVNNAQTLRLLQTVAGFFDGSELLLLDAYCGIGTFGLYLAAKLPHLQRLVGVEINQSAVADANANAALNRIDNAIFYCGAAEKKFSAITAAHGHPDVVIVDPPRRGCHPALLAGLLELAPAKIIYVSCDPATLARDLGKLAKKYNLVSIQPLDMFPRTAHVETVVLLSKLNAKQHIEVELNLDELDLTSAESKATYDEIKAYVLEKYGLKVSSLYISQVKRKCGLDVGQNYNLSKKEDAKVPQCPPEKKTAIMEALKHFQMI